VKIIKLDRRHNLYHKGYTYAFVVNRFNADSNKLVQAVTELEGFRWDNTFWGKHTEYNRYNRPYYVGVKTESTLTLALLKV